MQLDMILSRSLRASTDLCALAWTCCSDSCTVNPHNPKKVKRRANILRWVKAVTSGLPDVPLSRNAGLHNLHSPLRSKITREARSASGADGRDFGLRQTAAYTAPRKNREGPKKNYRNLSFSAHSNTAYAMKGCLHDPAYLDWRQSVSCREGLDAASITQAPITIKSLAARNRSLCETEPPRNLDPFTSSAATDALLDMKNGKFAVRPTNIVGSSPDAGLCEQPDGKITAGSFIDWKMMEHQDYQTIPDDLFDKLSRNLHIKKKWRPMISYLVSLGLSTCELEKVLVNCEEVFRRPVAKVVARVEYLQNELGFEGAELRKLIKKEPNVLLQRNSHSIPRCRYLMELGIPAEKLPTLLRKQPQILHLSVQNGLMPRVAYFKNELLVSDAEVVKLIERNPAVLTFSIEKQIKPRVDFLKDLGISHKSVVKMIVRHPRILQYSFDGLGEHINFLMSIGMDEEDIVHTVTRLSQLFSLSVRDSLRPKYDYLTGELGGDLKTCVKFPAYFSLSLDKRIKPRHTFLKRFKCAPEPFPMKYLSENDTAFAARANRSLEEFEEYREEVVPIFRMETLRRKAQADESFQTDLQHHRKREARLEQQHRLLDRNQGYSQRTIDARNSMNRVKLLGVSRKSH